MHAVYPQALQDSPRVRTKCSSGSSPSRLTTASQPMLEPTTMRAQGPRAHAHTVSAASGVSRARQGLSLRHSQPCGATAAAASVVSLALRPPLAAPPPPQTLPPLPIPHPSRDPPPLCLCRSDTLMGLAGPLSPSDDAAAEPDDAALFIPSGPCRVLEPCRAPEPEPAGRTEPSNSHNLGRGAQLCGCGCARACVKGHKSHMHTGGCWPSYTG